MDDIHRPYLIQRVLAAPNIVYTLKRCRVLIAPPVVGFCCCGCCKIWSLLFSLHLLELLPECCILLVVFGIFGGCWVVFDKPSEELSVVDFVAEHFLTAGSVK